MWSEYYIPASLDEALHLLAEKREKARLVAGATDLMLELERGLRKDVEAVVDITRLPDLDRISLDEDGTIHLGPLVTHNAVTASKLLRECAFPLVNASWQVGSPQIRNRGTVAGNLVTASPANDTIPPLVALGALVMLASTKGTRRVPLDAFYTGVRKTVMQPDEMLVDIAFPAAGKNQHGTFLKLGLRRAQAISLVNTAIILDLSPSTGRGKGLQRVASAVITLGAVAPTIIHASEAESFLTGTELTDETIARAAEMAASASRPIDDIRGSAAYRKAMVNVLVRHGLRYLRDGEERAEFPGAPALLWGKRSSSRSPQSVGYSGIIHTTINGKEFTFTNGLEKPLLDLLREEAGLTGTKEGCSEGECGACTVFLDGKAVLACLIPAPCANGADIVTVEGLSLNNELHPVQQAFIEDGAVQCGYCTPGFIMSAVKLLEENPRPTRNEIVQAITGNLCRCTGYYKIVQAIEDATRL